MQIVSRYSINQHNNCNYKSNLAFYGVTPKMLEIPQGKLKRDTKFMVDNIMHAFWEIKAMLESKSEEGLEFINSECIGSTRLAEITIPATIQEISYSAFVGCPELKSVYIKAITPPKHPNNYLFGFANDLENRKIYVPRQSLEAYRTSESWKAYASIIEGYDF